MIKTLIRKGEYHDSVALMLLARELSTFQKIHDASVVMGTPANKSLLLEAGLLTEEARACGADDLILAVKADEEASCDAALAHGLRLMAREAPQQKGSSQVKPRSVRAAVKSLAGANLALISVAGAYAPAQAWDALHAGMHVMLFSDHVSVEDERALKQYGRAHDLLVMGPGAGTAIINGVGLGFANAVQRGPVGIVAAAGTGLQEVSSLLSRQGVGISQAIGTGGRDVSAAVGGITLQMGLRALIEDPETGYLLVVSKIPSMQVMAQVVDSLAGCPKPVVFALMGAEAPFVLPDGQYQAETLREAAALVAGLAQRKSPADIRQTLRSEDEQLRVLGESLRKSLQPDQRYLRGLYSGGTLCEETQRLWSASLGSVWSNAPLHAEHQLKDSSRSLAHTVLDLGEEEFTIGRPHPMIDLEVRLRRIGQEARDQEVAAIVLDVVIGHGTHPDPASSLAAVIMRVKDEARKAGRSLPVIASVTGTESDPQGYSRQVAALKAGGAVVMESNAAAAVLAAHLISPRA